MRIKADNKVIMWSLIITGVFCFIIFGKINLAYIDITNSDIAQTGIWSRAIWETKSLLPTNYLAWSESGIYSLAIIGAPIYGLTKSIWFAQVIPPIITSFLYLLSVIYLLKGIKLSVVAIAEFVIMLFAFPITFYPQSMIFLYYAAYVQVLITMFWILGDYIRLITGELKKPYLHVGIQIIFACLQGMNSSRAVLMVYAPLITLECLRVIVTLAKKRKYNNKYASIMTLGCFLASYLMNKLPFTVQAGLDIDLSGAMERFTSLVIPRFLSFMGLGTNNCFYRIIIIFSLIFSCIVAVYCLIKFDMTDPCTMALVFFWASFLITVILVTIKENGEVAGRYYICAYFIIYLSFIYALYKWNIHRHIRTSVVTILLLYCIINLITYYIPLTKEQKNSEYKELLSWMEQKNITYGYSNYIYANGMTVSMDGKVQISAINLSDLSICQWVTCKEWYPPFLQDQTEIVYIIGNDDKDQFVNTISNYDDIEEAYHTDHYTVYTSFINHAWQ